MEILPHSHPQLQSLSLGADGENKPTVGVTGSTCVQLYRPALNNLRECRRGEGGETWGKGSHQQDTTPCSNCGAQERSNSQEYSLVPGLGNGVGYDLIH